MPPSTANPGSILIVEILFDPPTPHPDPGGEWIVLHNRSGASLRLQGWTISDSQSTTLLPVIDFPADALLLIAAAEVGEGDGFPTAALRVTIDGRIGNGLRNRGDSVRLTDGAGTVIDAVSWGDDTSIFQPPVTGLEAGQPMRRSAAQDTDTARDWKPPDEPSPTETATNLPVEPPAQEPASPPVDEPVVPTVVAPVTRPEVAPIGNPTPTAQPQPAPSATPILLATSVILVPATPVQANRPVQPVASTPVVQPPLAAAPAPVIAATALPPAGGAVVPAGNSGGGHVILSEIAPEYGWVELYNRGPGTTDLTGWSLVDSAGSPPVPLQTTLIPAQGFVVITTFNFPLAQPQQRLVLLRPDGTIADTVEAGPVNAGRGWSRFPVHGGGWMPNAPLTRGNFNQSAPSTPTPSSMAAGKEREQEEHEAEPIAPQSIWALDPLILLSMCCMGFAIICYRLIRQSRPKE